MEKSWRSIDKSLYQKVQKQKKTKKNNVWYDERWRREDLPAENKIAIQHIAQYIIYKKY